MTEEEWLAATDPTPMLEFLRDKISDRKLRLLACACCRPHASDVGGDDADIAEMAVTLAELQADGSQVERELQTTLCKLMRYPSFESQGGAYQRYSGFVVALELRHHTLASTLTCLAEAAGKDGQPTPADQESGRVVNGPSVNAAVEHERRAQLVFLYDIFGNPFRPVTVDPAWLTSDVVSLAEGIYADRAFDRMPILADALQDAGCDNADILNHCRSDGPHVRGCFVVDLLLGKE